MTPRNLFALFAIVGASLACFNEARLQGGRFARMFGTYAEVMDAIERRYVAPTDERKLFEAGLHGMVGSLDEYSAYIPPRQAEELRADLEQKFGGIGISVLKDDATGRLVISSPLYGTPAYEAGILAGDTIAGINGASTEKMSIEDAFGLLRGPIGEAVRLQIVRQGLDAPLDLDLTRAEISVESVLGDAHETDSHWSFFLEGEDRIGYVRIRSFGENTVEELRTALAWLEDRNVRGLVLDLRDDAGGLLDAAKEVCDMFLDKGVIVSTHGRGDVELDRTEATTGTLCKADVPVVVLVNRWSASASEIVAACLQDNQRATIVGERTWGKGTVQEVLPLGAEHGILKLTTATYWRPSGHNIHRTTVREEDEDGEWGVRPDAECEVKLTKEQEDEIHRVRRERDVIRRGSPMPVPLAQASDPQLQKALEALHAKLDGAAK